MESKVKEAVQRKMCGYNCAQAVACTYCEQAGLDEETVKNLTQGFAVGMGGSMEATCAQTPVGFPLYSIAAGKAAALRFCSIFRTSSAMYSKNFLSR